MCALSAAKTVKNVWIGYYQNETVWNQEEIRKAKVSCAHTNSKLKPVYNVVVLCSLLLLFIHCTILQERIKSLHGKLSNFQVYHRVDYVNGTTCDLTGKPRRATVKVRYTIPVA